MSLELEKMLCPVSADDPGGSNAEYDALYVQLEEFAIGKPASTMGDSVVEGTDPDWRALKNACLKLWEKTRDLRVAMYLSIAEFSLEGMTGFSDSLAVVEYLVTDLWDSFYPRLDPDDDNDPTERLNIFSMISPAPGTYSDPLMFLNRFRMGKLIAGKKYTLRDYMILNGDLDAGEEKLDPVLFQGEMRAVPIEEMQKNKDLTDKIIGQLNHIRDTVNNIVPEGCSAFTGLLSELKVLQKFYGSFLLQQPTANVSGNDEQAETSGAAATFRAPAFFDIASYVPSSRSEALLLLKKAAEYFQNAEPTSPVPFLVDRAIRMATMSFLDLLGDIEPNAMEKGREIFGIRQENNE